MHTDKNILSISTAILFSLNANVRLQEKLLNKEQLDLIIENVIGKDTFWDSGVPKNSGEFLVYGSAYSTQATRGLGVSVNVGDVYKIIMVFGDRTWTQFGISEATPFKVIPVNYNYAFGGNNYDLNSIGKGYSNEAESSPQLPNIESPNQLIITKNDTPEPTGFEPYPPEWPQRSQYFTSYDNIDLSKEILYLPEAVKPEHFNTAPLDQRMASFFHGDEKIEIKNMHPLLPTITSELPRIRLRQFVIQKDANNEEEFRELGVRNDTLSLLPNLECGILTYRSTCNVENITANDISYLYSVVESLDDAPKSVEYYFQSLVSNGTIQTEETNTPELNDETKLNLIDHDDLTINGYNEDTSKEEHPLEDILYPNKVQDVDLETISQQLDNLGDDAMGLNALGKHMVNEVQKMMQSLSLTDQDVNKYAKQRQDNGLSALPSEEELIHQIQKIGITNPDLEKNLRDNMKSLTEAMQKLEKLETS